MTFHCFSKVCKNLCFLQLNDCGTNIAFLKRKTFSNPTVVKFAFAFKLSPHPLYYWPVCH